MLSERADLAKRREHFELPGPDKDDHYASGLATEIRTWLRSLPIGEAIKQAASDPVVAAAALHAPKGLSGLDDEGIKRARNFLTEHLFGPELKILAAEEAVVDEATNALTVAEDDLRREIDQLPKAA